jgi:hypothetical protein
VVLLFQPAEEGLGGARHLVQAGALEGVGALHGLHVWPDLPAGALRMQGGARGSGQPHYPAGVGGSSRGVARRHAEAVLLARAVAHSTRGASCRAGVVGTRAGTIMAASDRFVVRVAGRGGHGALPHTARDPVLAASAIVLALQALVSRETAPVDAAVVTVSRCVRARWPRGRGPGGLRLAACGLRLPARVQGGAAGWRMELELWGVPCGWRVGGPHRFNTGPGAANVIPEAVELQVGLHCSPYSCMRAACSPCGQQGGGRCRFAEDRGRLHQSVRDAMRPTGPPGERLSTGPPSSGYVATWVATCVYWHWHWHCTGMRDVLLPTPTLAAGHGARAHGRDL